MIFKSKNERRDPFMQYVGLVDKPKNDIHSKIIITYHTYINSLNRL